MAGSKTGPCCTLKASLKALRDPLGDAQGYMPKPTGVASVRILSILHLEHGGADFPYRVAGVCSQAQMGMLLVSAYQKHVPVLQLSGLLCPLELLCQDVRVWPSCERGQLRPEHAVKEHQLLETVTRDAMCPGAAQGLYRSFSMLPVGCALLASCTGCNTQYEQGRCLLCDAC